MTIRVPRRTVWPNGINDGAAALVPVKAATRGLILSLPAILDWQKFSSSRKQMEVAMPHEFDFVAAYRNRAYALRLKAESMNAASARSDLLCIAAEYERMAAQAERTKGAVPPAEGTASANAG